MYIISYNLIKETFEIINTKYEPMMLSVLFLGLTEANMYNLYDLKPDIYRKKMVENFNGLIYKKKNHVEIIFKSIEDAGKAKEWLESIIIMYNLSFS